MDTLSLTVTKYSSLREPVPSLKQSARASKQWKHFPYRTDLTLLMVPSSPRAKRTTGHPRVFIKVLWKATVLESIDVFDTYKRFLGKTEEAPIQVITKFPNVAVKYQSKEGAQRVVRRFQLTMGDQETFLQALTLFDEYGIPYTSTPVGTDKPHHFSQYQGFSSSAHPSYMPYSQGFLLQPVSFHPQQKPNPVGYPQPPPHSENTLFPVVWPPLVTYSQPPPPLTVPFTSRHAAGIAPLSVAEAGGSRPDNELDSDLLKLAIAERLKDPRFLAFLARVEQHLDKV